jgi:hypothetical protein
MNFDMVLRPATQLLDSSESVERGDDPEFSRLEDHATIPLTSEGEDEDTSNETVAAFDVSFFMSIDIKDETRWLPIVNGLSIIPYITLISDRSPSD